MDAVAREVNHFFELEGVKLQICGSYRRGLAPQGGYSIVSEVVDQESRRKILLVVDEICETQAALEGLITFSVQGVPFNLHYADPEEWGSMLLWYTGSILFNVVLRGIAKKQGYKLNERGLWFGGDRIAGRSEKQIFDVLGIEYVGPKDRSMTPENRRSRVWLISKLDEGGKGDGKSKSGDR